DQTIPISHMISSSEILRVALRLRRAVLNRRILAALRLTNNSNDIVELSAQNRKQCDLLIGGAGPAGSFAAELLAKGGARVALFDGRPEGEPKACGGGVTAKALKAWPQLLNAVGRPINELDLYSPSSKKLHLNLDEPFAIYSRIAFDCYLRERARDAGAQIISEKISARKTKRSDTGWQVVSNAGIEWTSSFLI